MSSAATSTSALRSASPPGLPTPEFLTRWPRTPSRGERQRLVRALACACCLETAVIAGAWRLDRTRPDIAHEPGAASVAVVFSPPTEPATVPAVAVSSAESPPAENIPAVAAPLPEAGTPAPEPTAAPTAARSTLPDVNASLSQSAQEESAQEESAPAASVPSAAGAPALAASPAPDPQTAAPPAVTVAPREADAPVLPAEPPPSLRATTVQAPPPARQAPINRPLMRQAIAAQPRRLPRERRPPAEGAASTQTAPPAAPVEAASPSRARPQPSAGEVATFEGRIRQAVQAALRYPPAARVMGVTGRTRVAFAYRDGVVDGIGVARSAGTPMLDDAALAAVRAARYPRPPEDIAGQTLRLLVWVEFLPSQDSD